MTFNKTLFNNILNEIEKKFIRTKVPTILISS